MSSPIEAAKARHSLADVARRTGIPVREGPRGSITVRCPMPTHGHPDRTPSLRLHLDTGIWCCFACSPRKSNGNPMGADVIDWVRRTEGVSDWREVIRVLDSGAPLTNVWSETTAGDVKSARTQRRVTAQSTGIVSQQEFPNLDRTPLERVRTLLEAAWEYYTFRSLHQRGLDYLSTRGIDVGILEGYTGRAEVGHTPSSNDGLVRRMRATGFSDDELVDAGLAYRRLGDGRMTDFYRQQVLIPVRDRQGSIAGLIGRNVGDDRWPKYKNPPRTHLYDKSVNLYQPLPAPADLDGQVVVVEGTLDALAIAVAAIRADLPPKFCPVTQSGRELSPVQLDSVLGLHPRPPVIAFDGDRPGQESNARAAIAAAMKGRETVITTLPNGEDPASWLAQSGPAALIAWTRKGCLNPTFEGVRPTPPGGLVAAELWEAAREAAGRAGVEFERTQAMSAIVEQTNSCSERLPPAAAARWASSLGTAAGRFAVAEAQQYLVRRSPPVPAHLDHRDVDIHDGWEPEPEARTGFDALVGDHGIEALVQRVVRWQSKLPDIGAPAFIKAATSAVYDAGIDPRGRASDMLEMARKRPVAAISATEEATALTTYAPAVTAS